ncbi:MAG: cupin [Candidatus Levybacteria bacterium]|nr:cupin [Candidatus Levybacteria bacterium]
MQDYKQFKKTPFSNDSYIKRVEKPWGFELHWTPDNLPYMGKVLHVNKGARLSLQVHDKKQESWFLKSGRMKLLWDDDNGNLVETELEEGKGYTSQVGQRHRLVGITDAEVLEVSTPEEGVTYRLEDDYKRPDETEDMRKLPNRGWNG